ncbi:MAG: ribonuclease D [Chitinophagaceae bacterium]|nr:ribonuclease D [Chitinophagaceae bacterium]
MLMNCPEIHCPVFWIDTDLALETLCKGLLTKSLLAIDTEFDRFRRKYGINLELIQLFDGEQVYLIRVLSMSNLLPLKPIMENDQIIKVLYSGSEDIQVFKVNGIAPAGVYDLQPASQLSGFAAVSLSGLLEEVLQRQFDKSKQTSDWSKEHLDREQVIYAANDVIHLLELYQRVQTASIQYNTMAFIEEENRLLEAVQVSETIPRLKQQQREMFNRHEQAILLELMHVRDGLGKLVNKPPHFVLSDKQLEAIVQQRTNFGGKAQLLSYSVFFKRNEALLMKAHRDIVSALALAWPPPKTIASREVKPRTVKVTMDNEKLESFILAYQSWLKTKYTETIALYLCSGLKRFLREYVSDISEYNLANYKRTLLFQFATERGLDLKADLI